MRQRLGSYRLPTELIVNIPKNGDENATLNTDHLNQILVEIKDRLDTIQQVGVTVRPPAVQSLTAQGRQGLHYLRWQRQVNVDGYILLAASTSDMSKLVHRFNIADGDTCTFQVPVGNVAQQLWFTVQAYKGKQIGVQSTVATSTSVVFTTSEAAPAAPPSDPRSPRKAFIRNGTVI